MKNILFILLTIILSGGIYSQTNNNCANATTLTSGAARLCGQSIETPSTVEAGENTGTSTCVTAGTVNQSVWYKFVATSANMFVEFKVQTSAGSFWCSNQLAMAIYNTSTCLPGSASVLSCNAYTELDGAMVLNPTGLTVGNTYLVQISNYYVGSGNPKCQLTIPDFCMRVGNSPAVCSCTNICASGCGYATSPTVAEVTSTCPEYILNPVADGGTTKTYCYNFEAVNTTVSFSMIISSNCSSGNVTGLTWTLKTAACGANVATGTISNLSATGLTVGTTYVLCYTYSIPTTCHHTSLYPYFVGAATALPIEFGELFGYNLNEKNIIQWTTVSELDNDYFLIEHSVDGYNFKSIGEVKGKGSTTEEQYYIFEDDSFRKSVNYYRLVQVDYNGERTNSKIILIDNNPTNAKPIKTINLIGHEVGPDYTGLVIDVYEDGSTFKRYQY